MLHRAARAIEPALSPDLCGALRLQTDGHVNNRAVVSALICVCERHPAITLENAAALLVERPEFLLKIYEKSCERISPLSFIGISAYERKVEVVDKLGTRCSLSALLTGGASASQRVFRQERRVLLGS